MSLQAILNQDALDAVFKYEPDLKQWIDAQDTHHRNQLIYQLIDHGCRDIITAYEEKDAVSAMREAEIFCRAQDATFRESSGYISYSQWHTESCGIDWDGDENSGYSYATHFLSQ